MEIDEELVRERAYLLWEQAGRPEDRTLEFWYAAVRELEDAAAEAPSQQEPAVAAAEPEKPPPRLEKDVAAE